MILPYFVVPTALAFLYYGLACLFSDFTRSEFERYGIPQFRVLTGILQLCGALGIAIGLYYPLFGVLAASGLSLLMLSGFIVRIRIKDSLLKTLPSFLLMIVNAVFTFFFLQLLSLTER